MFWEQPVAQILSITLSAQLDHYEGTSEIGVGINLAL